ncbi:MAG: nucleotide kinase [Enterobacter phage ENC18]|nr:MAG: nucleotide kinase [Enterobacter phage ENC18]
MLQHHWNKPNLEARFPVNSAVRYSGANPLFKGLTGTVQGYSNTGRVNVRFGVREAEVHPAVLIPLPKVGPKVDAQKSEVKSDVTHPNHYMLFDNVEAIEVIARSMTVEAFRGYCLGNILKYRLRAGKKSELATMEKDLKKAAFYQELFDKHKGLCYDAS